MSSNNNKKGNSSNDNGGDDGKKMVLATRTMSQKPLKLVHILQNTKNYDAFSEQFKIHILAAWHDQFVGSHCKMLYCADDNGDLVLLNRAFNMIWTDRPTPKKDEKTEKQDRIHAQDDETSSEEEKDEEEEEEDETFEDAKEEDEERTTFRVYQMFSPFTKQIPLFVGRNGIQRVEPADNDDKSVPLIIDEHTHRIIKNSIVEQITVKINKSLKDELGGEYDTLVLGLRVMPCYGDRERLLNKTNPRWAEEIKRIREEAERIEQEIEKDAAQINAARQKQQLEQDKRDRENLEKLKSEAKRDAAGRKKKNKNKQKNQPRSAAKEEETASAVHKKIQEENRPFIVDNDHEDGGLEPEVPHTQEEEEKRMAEKLAEIAKNEEE